MAHFLIGFSFAFSIFSPPKLEQRTDPLFQHYASSVKKVNQINRLHT
ncbi:hypothetical protein ETSB_0701 [cyanobacterium endosymbiont of Epithemia turgida isolate EtSB Lake Yunoko]|nr:hypothetical protein ETSB_0701 [cyanobacterium endosymbiont of Epithemia turgida isolate EtSB Lake Yunoko]